MLSDNIKEKFDLLCVKYRKMLRTFDASEIDTLFGIVADTHQKSSSEPVAIVAEDMCPSSVQDETACLLEELRHVYEQLQDLGVSVDDVRQTLWPVEPISRLEVRENMTICFPDYDNKVIQFPRMQCCVYQLFLNHPEGLLLKSLPDYADELRDICLQSYSRKGGSMNIARVEQFIRNITDPTKHHLIEYISHIRKTIVTALGSDTLAKHYYIRGGRNHSYKITISREFVTSY